MKVEITKAQLKAIEDGIDTLEAMIGVGQEDFDNEASKAVMMFDRFLKKNNLRPRKYGNKK